jgi:hypothetical protein
MLRLAESLVYENDNVTAAKVQELASTYVTSLKALSGSALDAKKAEAKSVQGALRYLAKFEFVPATYAPKVALDQFTKASGWDDEKR